MAADYGWPRRSGQRKTYEFEQDFKLNDGRIRNSGLSENGVFLLPDFRRPAQQNRTGRPMEANADYDSYQLKRLTICNTRDVFVPVKSVTS